MKSASRPCYCLLAAALLASAAVPARAGPAVSQIRIGALDHATRPTSSGYEGGTDFNLEVVLDPLYLPGTPTPYLGITLNAGDDNTDQLYGGLMWRWQPVGDLVVGLGLGVAVHNGELGPAKPERRGLGRRWLLHAAIETGLRLTPHYDLAVHYQHSSNGPLHGVGGANDGLDNVGVRLGYRFR